MMWNGMEGLPRDYYGNRSFSVGELAAEEKQRLFAIYGTQVEDIEPLSEEERDVFLKRGLISPNMFTQSLYKVTCKQGDVDGRYQILSRTLEASGEILSPQKHGNYVIEPQSFKQHAKNLMKMCPALRSNFYKSISGEIWRVVLVEKPLPLHFGVIDAEFPEEVEEKIGHIMEADRREGFDLERGTLVRASVFRLKKNEFAVLLSGLRLVTTRVDVSLWFHWLKPLWNTEPIQKPPKNLVDSSKYWKELVKGAFLNSKLLGQKSSESFVSKSSILRIGKRGTSQIAEKIPKENRNFWIALLGTAWGILLHQYNGSKDLAYPIIMPDLGASLRSASKVLDYQIFPMRLTCQMTGVTVRDLIKKQMVQLLQSASMGSFPVQNGPRVYISFQSFWAETVPYTELSDEVGFQRAAIHAIDMELGDFVLYFRFNGAMIKLEAIYNANAVSWEAAEKILAHYGMVIQAMLEGWNQDIQDLNSVLRGRLADVVSRTIPTDFQVVSMLRKTAFLSDLEDASLLEIVFASKVDCFMQEETILQEGAVQDNLCILLQGKAVCWQVNLDGWPSPVKGLRAGDVVSYDVALEGNSLIGATAMEDYTLVFFLPMEDFRRILERNGKLAWKFSQALAKEMCRYRKLWLME